jgi:hypothetical protein
VTQGSQHARRYEKVITQSSGGAGQNTIFHDYASRRAEGIGDGVATALKPVQSVSSIFEDRAVDYGYLSACLETQFLTQR